MQRRAITVRSAKQQQVSGRAMKYIALDCSLERSMAVIAVAIWPGAVEENARVARGADAIAPGIIPLAPLELHHQAIILVLLLGAEISQAITRDVNHPVGDR